MKGILADVNVEGHFHALMAIIQSDPWIEFWAYLNLQALRFRDVGLANDTPDRIVWETCQREEMILITGNRNAEGPDSLEETIRTQGTLQSLPVITLAKAERILRERSYAERAAIRILDVLTQVDRNRGSGRLYAP